MIWLGWRLQRTETFVTAAVVALLAALFIPAGLHLASVLAHDGLLHCLNHNEFPTSGGCDPGPYRLRQAG